MGVYINYTRNIQDIIAIRYIYTNNVLVILILEVKIYKT